MRMLPGLIAACLLALAGAAWAEPVSVSVGDTFSVSMEGNPTTGYLWELKALPDAVEPAGDAFVQKPAPKGMAGVGGCFVFRFKAVRAGGGDMVFAYARPWEKGDPVALRRVAVSVSEGGDCREGGLGGVK